MAITFLFLKIQSTHFYQIFLRMSLLCTTQQIQFFQRDQRHVSYASHHIYIKIIHFLCCTGADDMYRLPLDFAKDLGNAITGMTDIDTDFLTNDEAFKAGLDPLDLDEIQMLTDSGLVADPATEDSFKLDRL